jgi:hypothetical protein
MDEVATTAVRYARDGQPELPPEVTAMVAKVRGP